MNFYKSRIFLITNQHNSRKVNLLLPNRRAPSRVMATVSPQRIESGAFEDMAPGCLSSIYGSLSFEMSLPYMKFISPVQPSGAGIAKFGMLDSASVDGCRKFTLDLRQAPALIPSRDTYAVFSHLRIRHLI